MPMGSITINVRDGGLGLVGGANPNAVVVMGTCSATNTPALQSFSQIDDLVTALGQGPAVEAAAYQLTVAGGSVYVMPLNASVVGLIAAFTVARSGSSTGTITSSGAPYDAYLLKVKVVSAGVGQLITSGNVQVKVSLDGGTTYGNMVIVPASGTLALTKASGAVPQNTGLTLAFTVSTTTFDADDVHSAVCQAPYYSSSDLAAGFTALLADARTWGLIHVVGFPTAGNSSANAIASAVMASTIITNMTAAANAYRYARAIMNVPPSSDADLISAFGAIADPRLMRAATTDMITSVLTGAVIARGHSVPLVGRLALVNPSRSPGIADDGPLPGVLSATRDERKTPGLYDQGFSVARTIIGRSGIYCDLGRTSTGAGSDFSIIMNGRVMDLVCQAAYQGSLHFQNTVIKVTPQGTILLADATTIENYIKAKIQALAGTEFSSCTVSVYKSDNILSTQTLRVKIRVIPYGYAASVEVDVGFENPSLALAA